MFFLNYTFQIYKPFFLNFVKFKLFLSFLYTEKNFLTLQFIIINSIFPNFLLLKPKKKRPLNNILGKFINFFISKGLKVKLFKFIMLSLNKFIKNTNSLLLNFLLLFFVDFFLIENKKKFNDNFNNSINENGLRFFSENLFLSKLIFFFIKTNPVFILKFQRIDKKVRKFSRGKSGKYKCVFNYLPQFKRLDFLFLVLKKDFIFSKPRMFFQKIVFLLKNYFINNQSLIFNIKKFSNYYFFRNTVAKTII